MKKETGNSITPLHDIVREQAMDQMLFAYIQGAAEFTPDLSISDAIRRFCDSFGIDDYSLEAMRRKYYRNRCKYIRKQNIFK
jgi:hypothetical protein